MSASDFILKSSRWKSVKERNYNVAILPWGATEAHNYHLPYGTDCYETERIATEAARRANEVGAAVMVLPTVPFGVNTQQLDIKFTVNMNPATQALVLADVVESLEGHGIEKLMILNGHGGNDFRQTIRELQNQTDIFLCQVEWFRIKPEEGLFGEPGDHAGELETSLMLYLKPDLVLPLLEAGSGKARKFKIDGLNQRWAWAPRQWTQISGDTGVGNPAAASVEKGERYFNQVVDEIAEFIVELADSDVGDMYI